MYGKMDCQTSANANIRLCPCTLVGARAAEPSMGPIGRLLLIRTLDGSPLLGG